MIPKPPKVECSFLHPTFIFLAMLRMLRRPWLNSSRSSSASSMPFVVVLIPSDLEMRHLFSQIWGWGSFPIIAPHLVWCEALINEVPHTLRHLTSDALKRCISRWGTSTHIASVRCLAQGSLCETPEVPLFLVYYHFARHLTAPFALLKAEVPQKFNIWASWGALWPTHYRGTSWGASSSYITNQVKYYPGHLILQGDYRVVLTPWSVNILIRKAIT